MRLTPAVALGIVTATLLAVRLALASVTPLTEDEAYYRLWSMRPALGYFDHPPMIAWWIWLGRHLAGDTPLGVRLVPVVGAAITTWLTYDVARQLGLGERVALRAAIWLNATLLIGLGGALAAPDAPNSLFWTATLAAAFRAVRGRPAWWLAAGAAAGLACLSKYSALFLAPGVLVWLASSTDGRQALRTPLPWLAALVAAAVFAPNVAWNASHGWMTFGKQFGRIAVGGFDPLYLAKLAADQALLLNPLIAVFVALAVRRGAARPLLAISAPFALYLVFHSLHAEVQGQWPAPLYPALVIAAAAAADSVAPAGWLARLRTAAPWAGFAASAAAVALVAATDDGRLPFRDPAHDFRGWPRFAAAVERARIAAGASWIGAPTYGLAAQLAAARAIHAPVAELFDRQRYTFETPAERVDFIRPGLLVIQRRRFRQGWPGECFARAEPLADIVRGQGEGATDYAVFEVAGPKRDLQTLGCFGRPDTP